MCMRWPDTGWWHLNAQFRLWSSTCLDSHYLPCKELQNSTPRTASQVVSQLFEQFWLSSAECMINRLSTKARYKGTAQRSPAKDVVISVLWMKKPYPTAMFNSLKQSQKLPWSCMCIIAPSNLQDDCQKILMANKLISVASPGISAR